MNPLVSVIIPIYNMELYIKRCVESVINQDYKELEIILVDDGSTDSSGDICDSFKKNDGRVIVEHKKNEGLVKARKTGLKMAHGVFAIYIDADDYISKSMISVFMDVENKYSPDIIQCGMWVEYDDKNPQIIDDGIKEGMYLLQKDEDFVTRRIFGDKKSKIKRLRSNLWSCMFKKELLHRVQMEIDERITNGEDDACYYPCMLTADTYYYINQYLYNHYERPKSMSRDYLGFSTDDVRKIEDEIRPYVDKHKFKDRLIPSFDDYITDIYFRHFYMSTGIKIEKVFLLPLSIAPLGSRVIIYGYGSVGKDYLDQIRDYECFSVLGVCDKKKEDVEKTEKYIDISEIKNMDYDYVIIAVYGEKIMKEIRDNLLENEVDDKKIKWLRPTNSQFIRRIKKFNSEERV